VNRNVATPEIDYETSVIWCEDLTRAIIDDRTAGFCKMIADRRTHKVLGAHIVGERAVETVQLMATIMAGGLTVEQVADLELAFPTYSAIILMAARDLKYKLDPEYAALYQSGMAGSPPARRCPDLLRPSDAVAPARKSPRRAALASTPCLPASTS